MRGILYLHACAARINVRCKSILFYSAPADLFSLATNALIYSSIAFHPPPPPLHSARFGFERRRGARARALCRSNENGKRVLASLNLFLISAPLLTSSRTPRPLLTSLVVAQLLMGLIQMHNPQSRRARRSAGGRRTGRESAKRSARGRGRGRHCPTPP